MNKKTIYSDEDARYTDAPSDVEEAFARSVRIDDFLPPPEKLVFKTGGTNIKTQKSRPSSRFRAVVSPGI